MPLPIITTSAVFGSSLVERWAVSKAEGCECQNEVVDFSLGGSHGSLFLGIVGLRRDMSVSVVRVCSPRNRRLSHNNRLNGSQASKISGGRTESVSSKHTRWGISEIRWFVLESVRLLVPRETHVGRRRNS